MNGGEIVWSFETANFRTVLEITPSYGYEYDGDDEDGETQRALDDGEYIAFDSAVIVYGPNGEEIACSALGVSVYKDGEQAEFWTAHRSADPMNRNCTLMRRAWQGQNDPDAKVSICHYFPGMVAEAIAEARKAMVTIQGVRVRSAA